MFSARQAFAQIARMMGWTEQAKLVASDRTNNDYFGASIAISSDGNTVAVGAYLEDTSPNTNNGAAYVFTRSGTTWTQQAKLLASDAASYDEFGNSIAISADGNTVAVGASRESSVWPSVEGAAYIFTRSGTTWIQQAKLVASDRTDGDQFGYSIAISSDGNTVAVGVPMEGNSVPSDQLGAVYIFTRSGTTWTQRGKIVSSVRGSFYRFGESVDISGDGNTLAVGAIGEDTSPNTDNGAAYIFTRSGTTWTQQAKLLASDAASYDEFGSSIAISDDGTTVAVGAVNEDTAPNTNNGAAYVFTRSGTTWTQQAKLLASDAASYDYFGDSIAISSDGNTVAVGANRESSSPNTNNGAAYIFTRSGTTWRQRAKLLASDRASSDQFGYSISISSDGDTVAVGAYLEDTSPNTNNGAAYIFQRT